MDKDRYLEEILSDFMKNASPDEVRELDRMLAQRKGRQGGAASLDPHDFARNMARDIKKQVGLTSENVRRTAVDMVVRLARQHKPDISEAELQALVREMVPGSSLGESSAAIPPEILKTMVMHYVLFRKGRMSVEDLQGLPPGWHHRYWELFPEKVKKDINRFLRGHLEAGEFWRCVERDIS